MAVYACGSLNCSSYLPTLPEYSGDSQETREISWTLGTAPGCPTHSPLLVPTLVADYLVAGHKYLWTVMSLLCYPPFFKSVVDRWKQLVMFSSSRVSYNQSDALCIMYDVFTGRCGEEHSGVRAHSPG